MKAGRIVVLTILLMMFGTWTYADECNSLRYSDNGDGTVTDCRTGLIWLKDANCRDEANGIPNPDGQLLWHDAMKWVAGLKDGLCGLSDNSSAGDWRLPTKTEWMAMVASAKKQGFGYPSLTNAAGTAIWTTNGDAFNNVQDGYYYWSSTTNTNNTSEAWDVLMANADVNPFSKTDYGDCVWPVRGGQSGTIGTLFIE